MGKNLVVLFTTQNTQYSAEVESLTDEFFKDSLYAVNLKLSSSSGVDSTSVGLIVHNNDDNPNINNMELLNGKYSAKIKFEKEGKHVLEFTFKLIGDDGISKSTGFSFNTNVKTYNHDNMHNHDGMMGMGSTGFWIIMGGVMAGMMAVIMILSSHK